MTRAPRNARADGRLWTALPNWSATYFHACKCCHSWTPSPAQQSTNHPTRETDYARLCRLTPSQVKPPLSAKASLHQGAWASLCAIANESQRTRVVCSAGAVTLRAAGGRDCLGCKLLTAMYVAVCLQCKSLTNLPNLPLMPYWFSSALHLDLQCLLRHVHVYACVS